MHLYQVSNVIAPLNVAALFAPMLTYEAVALVRFREPGEFAVSLVTLLVATEVIGELPG